MGNTLIDLTGERFGKLLVVGKAEPRIDSQGKEISMWKCQCDCGKEVNVSTRNLKYKYTTSCGCLRQGNKGIGTNLIGQKFERLTVIKEIPKAERKSPDFKWLCKCDCGNETISTTSKLINGHQVSCGCKRTERVAQLNRKYKCTNKHLYGVYKAMINRCTNENDPSYHNYGGRKVTVCDEWLNDFDAFADWALSNGYVLDAPQWQYTLDREDNEKGYSPDNCRWVTMQVQQNNKRTCRMIEYGGETHSIADWARIYGMKYKYLYNRLTYQGMTLDEVIKGYRRCS